MTKTDFFNQEPPGFAPLFSVIAARYRGEWLLVRQAVRETWEIPGGHIEPGESPLAAAERELWEETGAAEFTLDFVSRYRVTREGESGDGCLFFAEIQSLGALPGYEIAECRSFACLPESLTYPQIQPQLHHRVQAWLNLQSNADELWDVCDSARRPAGRTHRRGDPLPAGDYHLTVQVWLQNSAGDFLVTKRSANKGFPLLWECTGGSALAGDDSLQAALREAKEEIGITLLPENGRLCFTHTFADSFCDVWLFRQEIDLAEVVLQPDETCDAQWASAAKIRELWQAGLFVPLRKIEQLLAQLEG